MYADDGVIFSKAPITVEAVEEMFESVGLELNREKSKPVEDTLKFLGLKISPLGLESNTREGPTLLLESPHC